VEIEKVTVHTEVISEITIKLTESEARAIACLADYGVDEFIKVFKEKLGGRITPYEKGLRTFLHYVSDLNMEFHKIDDARKALDPKRRCGKNVPDKNGLLQKNRICVALFGHDGECLS